MSIYLVVLTKDGIFSLNLIRIARISVNAVLRMNHKLQQVMKNQDDCKALEGLLFIDDAYWGGKKRDGKRGRAATGKMLLVVYLSLSPEEHPCFSNSVTSAISLKTKYPIGVQSISGLNAMYYLMA